MRNRWSISTVVVVNLSGADGQFYAEYSVINLAYEKTMGCEFKSYLEAIKDADTVIAVYDPDDPLCEREAAATAVAEMLNRQVITVDPKTIRLF